MSTTGNSSSGNTVERVRSLVEPIADDYAIELVDIEFTGGVLRVSIDEPDGIESQTIVEVTKAISRMLDAEDPISGKFSLEVSSPGVERPLKKPEHFARAVGDQVTVKTNPDVEGERRIDGTLVDADEYGVTVEGAEGPRTLRYGEIRSARTIFDWGPAPKPGKGGKKKASAHNENSTKEAAAR